MNGESVWYATTLVLLFGGLLFFPVTGVLWIWSVFPPEVLANLVLTGALVFTTGMAVLLLGGPD